jgi:ACS family hexuronate transporter-like MFS transporter
VNRIHNYRWWVAGFVGSATALNYLDRQNFPVAVVEIQKHIAITDEQYSHLLMLFLLAYAVMYAGGGKIADLLGTRLGYTVMIVWWSAANILHGMVSTIAGLGVARFLLGLGEGGGFPCSAKAVSEWFPPEERAMGFGIFNTGSSVGAVIAPPLIALIVVTLNWRWVLFITGTLGFLWVAAWWPFYRRPPKDDTSVERPEPGPKQRISWIGLFRYRQIWGLLAAKFLTDSAWFFFIFWLPKYLADVRHLDIKQIGYYAWIPYACAGIGSFAGGWLSGFFIRRRLTIDTSRKVCLGISAAMMPASLLIAASPLAVAIVFFSMAFFAHQFWSTILQTLAADLFPSKIVGSVAGLMGCIGSFGAMIFNLLVGLMLAHYQTYSGVLTIAGLLHPCSFLVILLLVRHIAPVVEHKAVPCRI